jgi:predicted acetyltransferase
VTTTGITARPIVETEFDEWARIESAAFGGFPDPQHVELERKLLPFDRIIGAFDGDRVVGAAASYPFEMTVPGGAVIPVAGVTAVGVAGTDRRRGALRSMMTFQLDDVARRGEVAAILNASESSIYGRFGYGLAQQYQRVRLRSERIRFTPAPPERTLRLVPKEAAADALRPMFDAYRRTRAGEVARPDAWWGGVLGDVATWKGGGKIFVVTAEPTSDDPGGYVIYELAERELSPFKKMVVRELVAATPDTESALWRYCVELDLVDEVEVEARPLDDPIRWRIEDPRQYRVVWQYDFGWVRLLDVEAALSARAYGTDAAIVLDVVDDLRPDVAARYRLLASAKGGECARTDDDADLALTVADLGALYLGGVQASTLARAGRIRELRSDALGVADRVFGWSLAPHCTTRY